MRAETLHVVSDYITEAFNFIALREGFRDGVPYFDTANPRRATIGYGFNIEVTDYLLFVLNELGIVNDTMTEAEITARRQAFTTAINNTPDGNNPALITNLNQAAAQYGVAQFSINETQGRSIFEDIILGLEFGPITIQGKQQKLDALLQNTLAHNSKEYIAVMSLFYNGESLVGPNLRGAIINDNRAEAWFEIRYNSNRNGIHANRRYSEANLFSLYDYGSYAGSLTADEAKEVMRMYTIHKADIYDYERKYSPPLNQNILSIDNEILLAKDYLLDNFAQGTNIEGEIIVGKGLDSYSYTPDEKNNPNDAVLLGTANNDLIFGEAGDDGIIGMDGDDVIYGGEGNDTIIGGTGNDILEGGAGDDRYYFQSGDGSDKINDSEGKNQIIWEDSNGDLHVEKTFYKTADAQWKSADGTTSVNHNSPYKMVFPDGTTVELGDSISSFDINLKDVPSNPTTNHEIIEDNWYDEAFLGGIIDTASRHLLVV